MPTPPDPAAAADADAAAWRAKRSADAQALAEAHRQRREAESDEARILVRSFAENALAAGLEPHALRAYAYDNRANYKTRLQGWRLQRSGLLAVSVAGEFYNLSVPSNLRARFTGVRLEPVDPPMIVGLGGPDGTSMALAELLQLRLDGGNDWRP